ncbi:MAG TPA: hypothetical protein VN041_05895 [Microbacterium sp.]|nr:hypothetical protein [Microbacterium sp.]
MARIHDTWMRLEDGAIITLHGLLGDQIIWAYRGDETAMFTHHEAFVRDHRQVTLH